MVDEKWYLTKKIGRTFLMFDQLALLLVVIQIYTRKYFVEKFNILGVLKGRLEKEMTIYGGWVSHGGLKLEQEGVKTRVLKALKCSHTHM